MGNNNYGIIHVYCGDCFTRTLAHTGLCVRSAGHGFKSLIIHFGDFQTGPFHIVKTRLAKKLYCIKTIPAGHGSKEKFSHAQSQKQLAREAENYSQKFSLIVLENVLDDPKLFDWVIAYCEKKPEKLELVLTGKKCHDRFVKVANLVTDFRTLKTGPRFR